MFHHHAHHFLSSFWLIAFAIRHPLIAAISAGKLVWWVWCSAEGAGGGVLFVVVLLTCFVVGAARADYWTCPDGQQGTVVVNGAGHPARMDGAGAPGSRSL